MDYLISNLLATAPSGMWEKILMSFESAFMSFALSIIMLTIIIKIVMLPLDYFNRRINKKNAEMQAKMQPAMDAINKKFPNDKEKQNQKLAELYKKEKFNPIGSCLIMLVNLGLTLAIFFTLFNGLNAMASYKIKDQYENLQVSYVENYVLDNYDIKLDKEAIEKSGKTVYEVIKPYLDEMNAISDENQKKEIISTANQNVIKKYNGSDNNDKGVKESFLWIDNIWLADNPFVNSIPSFSSYASTAKLSNDEKKSEELKNVYEQIMNPLGETSGRANGYFILVVLSAVTAFLNQWLMTKVSKKDKDKGTKTPQNKLLLIVLPLIMGVFTLFYTTMFSLYIVASQVVSIATVPLLNAIGNAVDKRKAKKDEPTGRMKRI